MFPRVFVALLLTACAGPAVHRTPATPEAEATRVAVATTLAPADPLAAPSCGLPTAAGTCTEVTPPAEQQDEHHHHHAPQTPAPTAPPPAAPPPAEPKKEEHHHHHPPPSSATPVNAPAESSEVASVKDPVCGMTITPGTARGGTLTVRGTPHWFCSSSCRRTFLTQNPEAK